MNKCIFCKTVESEFNTKEHILPESLGGGEWAILPKGLMCDKCQNIFGSTIEKQALDDYPFSHIRAFIGIPTKKGKAPWFNSWEGKIGASPWPGVVAYEPAPMFKEAVNSGKKTVMRLLAHPSKPSMICRFLIKMGLEVLAEKDKEWVFEEKYDKAREYALKGVKNDKWWYLENDDLVKWNTCVKNGITEKDKIQLAIIHVGEGAFAFYFKLFFVCFIVPLEQRIIAPSMEALPEPIYRLFIV